MTNLIYGVNPLSITSINWFEGYRYGEHPYKLKYLKKKHFILALFGVYDSYYFDGYYHPHIKIYGSNGSCVKSISCRSNDHAKQLWKELNAQLDSFLSDLKGT